MDPNVGGSIRAIWTDSGNYYKIPKGNEVTYEFSALYSDWYQEIWNLYQSIINQKSADHAPETLQCLIAAEELIKNKLRPDYKCTPLERSQKPELYFEKAKMVQGVVKEIFLSKVSSTASMTLVDNGFSENLDKSERLVVQVFKNLFDLYFKQENYEQAFHAAKEISATPQGKQALCNLAAIYVKFKFYDKAASVLDAIPSELNSDELSSLVPEGDTDVSMLVMALKNFPNVKSSIVAAFIDKGCEEAVDLVVHIKDIKAKRETYIKLIDLYLNNNKVEEALNIVKELSNEQQDQNYLKIVDYYIRTNNISKALSVISHIHTVYACAECYKKIADYYLGSKDIDNALKTISHIYQSIPYYIKAANYCLECNDIDNALKIIPRIGYDYLPINEKIVEIFILQHNISKAIEFIDKIPENKQLQHWIKIINYYKAREDMDNALLIIAKINDGNQRIQEYVYAIEWYLAHGKIKDIDDALKTVSQIPNVNLQKHYYLKIMDRYMFQNNIPKAFEVIRYIPYDDGGFFQNNDYEKRNFLKIVADEYVIKIVDYCIARGDTANALLIIAKIDSPDKRDQKYVNAIDGYLAHGKIKEAEGLMEHISYEHLKEQQKAKFSICKN